MADMFPSPGQPRRARGTVGHPYSALNLRLALAVFGMVFFGVLAVLLFSADLTLLGWAAVGLALIGLVDAIVIQHRRSVRRRGDPEDHTSLFE
jgi:membrane protein implicated in regulation of membrane protease activity